MIGIAQTVHPVHRTDFQIIPESSREWRTASFIPWKVTRVIAAASVNGQLATMRFSDTVFLFHKKYAPASGTWVLGVGAFFFCVGKLRQYNAKKIKELYVFEVDALTNNNLWSKII